jgi:hypothetical protein
VFVATIHNNAFVSMGHWSVSWRAIGFAAMLLGAYLALSLPLRLVDRQRARTAQLALAGFLLLGSASAAVIAWAISRSGTAWFSTDGFADGSMVTFLSTVALFGAILAVISTQALGKPAYNLGCLMSIPGWIVGIVDCMLLSYFWLSRGNAADVIHPGGTAAVVLAWITVAVIGLALLGVVSNLIGHAPLRAPFARAITVGAVGAANLTYMLIARGPGSWHTGYHVAGADLMGIAIALGVLVFAVTYWIEGAILPHPHPRHS